MCSLNEVNKHSQIKKETAQEVLNFSVRQHILTNSFETMKIFVSNLHTQDISGVHEGILMKKETGK